MATSTWTSVFTNTGDTNFRDWGSKLSAGLAAIGMVKTSDPAGVHGLMFDFVTTTGALVADISPTVDGFDGKATPDGLIPYTITNLSGSAAAVTATLTWISTE